MLELEARVCARSYDDLILATGRDGDERNAGRRVGGYADVRKIDAVGFEQRQRLFGERIGPDAPAQLHRGAQASGGERLVCALAAGMTGEGGAANGFAGDGQALGGRYQIEIDRPHDGDARRLHASLRSTNSNTPSASAPTAQRTRLGASRRN